MTRTWIVMLITLCCSLNLMAEGPVKTAKPDKAEKHEKHEKAQKAEKPKPVEATLTGLVSAVEYTDKNDKAKTKYVLDMDGTKVPLRHVYMVKDGDTKTKINVADYVDKTVTLAAKVIYDKDGEKIRHIAQVSSISAD